MRRLEGAITCALCAAWLAGCATSALEMAPPQPDRPWTPAITSEGEMIAGQKGAADAPTGGYVLPANPALAVFPPGPAIDETRDYTLPELIDLAQSSNPQTRIAWNDARRVALAAGIAESTYLPRITASAVGAYQSSSSNDSVLGFSGNGRESATGVISAVSLVWLLFDFGGRAAIVEAAKQASLVSNIAFTAAHQQVIYDVSLAFYANAAARTRLATATQSLKNTESVQAAAEDRRKHGIGTVVEVAQARQATAQANLALVQATGGAQDAHLRLVTAMGISPLTKIRIADVSDRQLSPAMAASVESIVSEALSRRPDVLGAYAAQKASLAKVRAAEAEFKPKIFMSATGAYNSGNLDVTALPSIGQQSPTVNINGKRLGGTVFAGVTIPLYDGGTRDAMLAQARADADSAEARLTRIREEAVRQIVLADNALRTSLAAHDASKALVSAAQTTFDAALGAYRGGVGSITDVNLAETQLLLARNVRADAYSTALSAAATLALSTGALGSSRP
ncbi:TolC family protein [Variovorax sp. dw_954]|uniref:TolC family protein n=1 Tax=Variovorax sp. dw_954 TaxID=2720078 RepID=UPI001BD37F62|nr:TolC family protein [Variovorax sp. dw_954]